jgi:arylsulfatase A-like enzyme
MSVSATPDVTGGGITRRAPTPRIDRLASQGLRLTNFNVESEYTPTRAALMTARMPIRSGCQRVRPPGLRSGLDGEARHLGWAARVPRRRRRRPMTCRHGR